jgi:chaperonin GroES
MIIIYYLILAKITLTKVLLYLASKSMNIKPLADYLVIKTVAEEMTKSGIVLPDTVSKERPEKGIVVASGEGRILENGLRQAMSVKVGDQVMFKKYSPDMIKLDGQEYLVIRESDILAILGE